ncbi:MAG: hypothetical protein KDJ31_13725 [Candidatus Competibacteraceae bacterium]|nr:hypothetical protein [Candidatus Competibacteraceae bacterium]MCB1820423.1 hypothetical protein [Candidatus Competibacteraceae bacterium]
MSLAERARRGLLVQDERLTLQEIVALEQPIDAKARKRLAAAMKTAKALGDLKTTVDVAQINYVMTNPDPRIRCRNLDGTPARRSATFTTIWVNREDYRIWRATLPDDWFSPVSAIGKWLDIPPSKTEGLTDSEIKARLEAGQSIAQIQRETRTPKSRIQKVKQRNNLPDAKPGPQAR